MSRSQRRTFVENVYQTHRFLTHPKPCMSCKSCLLKFPAKPAPLCHEKYPGSNVLNCDLDLAEMPFAEH